MEKETLRKIYLLKKIKPSNKWVSLNKREIMKEEESFSVSVFFRPAMAFSGVLLVLLITGLLQTAVAPAYEGGYPVVEKEEEAGVMIALEEGDLERKEFTIEEIDELRHDLRSVEKQYKQVQKEVIEAYVMASMVDNIEGEERKLDNREVAEHLLLEMENNYINYDSEKISLYSEAEEAFEKEDYDRVLDIFLSLR